MTRPTPPCWRARRRCCRNCASAPSRTEELRHLPPETERELHAAGLFRIVQPKRVGGAEFDYVALVDLAEVIARADASVAWNLVNLASHHWMLALFDPRAQDLVWDQNLDALVGSSFVFPAGRAEKVEGGYRLRGRWPFSSGVDSCDWNMLAGIVSTDDEADGIEYRIFLLPRKDYRILDVWNASGLKGTGSNDVEVTDVFVADAMTLAVSDVAGGPTPGSAVNPNPLYALPVFSLFPYVLTGVALGNAQACLDDYVDVARHRASTYNRTKLGDLQSTQIKIAEASAKIDAARLIMRATCIEAMADARRGHIPDMAVKTRYRRDGAYSRQPLHRGGIAAVRRQRRARAVHVGHAAAAIPRCPRDQFPHRVLVRCRRHQLRPGRARSAVRKPDALRWSDDGHPEAPATPIPPTNWPATTRRSIRGIFATRSEPTPPASP